MWQLKPLLPQWHHRYYNRHMLVWCLMLNTDVGAPIWYVSVAEYSWFRFPCTQTNVYSRPRLVNNNNNFNLILAIIQGRRWSKKCCSFLFQGFLFYFVFLFPIFNNNHPSNNVYMQFNLKVTSHPNYFVQRFTIF